MSLPVDGKHVVKSRPLLNEDGTVSEVDPGVELPVSKAAIEPVWYLPGVAERFGMWVPIRFLMLLLLHQYTRRI